MTLADVHITSRPYSHNQMAPYPTNALSRSEAEQPVDELDDLFNYEVDFNEVSRGANAETANRPTLSNERIRLDDTERLGLGIDEEIKVRKPRAPIAKLDEERLLSANGIPKLRRIAKDRFKFNGKGHEFTDISRLLNNYQLWLDDLFPKAKFADGLAIIEKLGHKKRLQVMRKEWIDEGKPKPVEQDISEHGKDLFHEEAFGVTAEKENSLETATPAHDLGGQDGLKAINQDMDDNIYREPTPPTPDVEKQHNLSPEAIGLHHEEPDLDELDDLLAEDVQKTNDNQESKLVVPQEASRDEFADEEEAMAEMEDMW